MTMSRPRAPKSVYRIPVFGLYGLAADSGTAGYAHIESISSRAPANDWHISTHRHADLAQCILVLSGGGVLDIEGRAIAMDPPWIVWLPVGVVHGFRFIPGTEGLVLTVSDDVVDAAIQGSVDRDRLSFLAAEPRYAPLSAAADIGIDVRHLMTAVAREQDLPRTAGDTVVVATISLLLVAMLRLKTLDTLDRHLGTVQASEFRRFREYVERSFRTQPTMKETAKALGITTDRLHAITTKAVGKGPLAIQHERIVLECKRELIYTRKRISEIAFDCGFQDMAYFSRFFARHAGCAPRVFRQMHAEAGED
ncbi:helix-turn-helix domain-containing protein [Phreatobacter sp.]|uniref:helix-turn-helix domain-containing protein n=1 Tax=Phreatobacter sp. TaxID=1966341 RepID=UPI003F700AF0